MESPELRWAFIRTVYAIISIQMLLTIVVAAAVVKVASISHFITTTRAGLAVFIIIAIIPFIVLGLLSCFYQSHPLNYFILTIFMVSLVFLVGLTCSYTNGKIILESAILTAVVVVSLTLYTFWAARRGHDFNFLGPFLSAALLDLILFGLIQIFFPLGKIGVMVYGCVASIVFCGYIYSIRHR